MKEMKNFFLALSAGIVAISLASCSQEKDAASQVIDEKTVAFSIVSGGTRGEASVSVRGASIPMGDPVDGYNLFLEETITELGAVPASAETRGTPVYTENFATMYTDFYGAAYSAEGNTLSATPVVPDGYFFRNMDIWERHFESDIYENDDVLYFFLREPKVIPGMTGGVPTYSLSGGRCLMDFDYTVPLNAADQQEVLITGRPVTREEARKRIPVLFHHALTGVKFATDNKNTDNVKTYITKVEILNGIWKSAHIRIRPTWENGEWKDDPEIHSSTVSTSDDSNNWVYRVSSGQQMGASSAFTLNLADGEVVDFETGGSFEHNGKYPDSFAKAGNKNNLNDADASKTFWLIPQPMNRNIWMDVTFHVISGGKDSGPITRRIKIGEILLQRDANATWKAGQLRTFTLKADLVDVDIVDKVSGFEKTDVVITNTGNMDAYIRAHITANWFGYAGSKYGVAVGYKGKNSSEFVDAWRMDGTTGDNLGGVFEGLPGSGWTRGADGFFYYTQAVPPGEPIPSPLFTKYSLDTTEHPVPEIWYVDTRSKRHAFTDVELVMEIPVQAIEVPEGKSWKQAWEAQGVTGLPNE